MLLFRIKDFYHIYGEDAKRAADILKLSVSQHPNPKLAQESEFPFRALDTYLPKLIRSGERVAICDYTQESEERRVKSEESVHNEKREGRVENEEPMENQARGMHR